MDDQVESFYEKAVRKTKQEPLVPIGALATVGFLCAGLYSLHKGTTQRSQYLMRGRVVAQGFTVLVMVTGAFFGVQPHDRPKTMEEKMNRANNSER